MSSLPSVASLLSETKDKEQQGIKQPCISRRNRGKYASDHE